MIEDLRDIFLKVVAFLLKIVKNEKRTLQNRNNCLTKNLFTIIFFFILMSTVLVQWCIILRANQWNTSDWVKYGNILVLSDTYFQIYVAYMAQWKPFIFAYLTQCPAESIGKLKYNVLLQCTCKILRMKRQTCCTDMFQCIFSCSHK